MSSPETRHLWTLCGLVKAFVDLALAYLLLCASTFAFFASLFLSFLGLGFPCPCRGVFGYRNADLCWHRILVDFPVGKINEVQALAKSRFPFREVVSGPRNQNLAGRESGSEVKGKSRAVNPKLKSGIRRRRRASSLAYGKFAGDGLACSVDHLVHKLGESSGILSGQEYGPQDDGDPPRGIYNPTGLETGPTNGPEAERIRTLERALNEARSACSALYAELEKERAAAASAADEAVAMIGRLQSDRASMEVEARQLERLIDERFAHDEDEIGTLKEILFLRERDNLFLQKDIESYRRMIIADEDETFVDDDDDDDMVVEKRSPCHDLRESVEKTVILVDHGDRAVMLDSVSEDTNDGHYAVEER